MGTDPRSLWIGATFRKQAEAMDAHGSAEKFCDAVGRCAYSRLVLRRLDVKDSYRSLHAGFWPSAVPLGKRSVIYGHNGSGKSCFASLLLEIASDDAPTEVVWEDDQGRQHTIRLGKGGPSPSMAVFTKAWVQRNLDEFLDGDTASPIVTLGEEAIEAKGEEARLEEEIARLRTAAQDAEKKRREAAGKAEKLAREAQEAVASQLREFDYARFTKNRYSITVVEGQLQGYKGKFPDENAHAEALKRLGEGAAERVPDPQTPPVMPTSVLAGLNALLAETPIRTALAPLEGDPARQSWVEAGRGLHEHLDECLFCGGPFTAERREQLAKHFDESWLQLRGRALALRNQVIQAKAALETWQESLPDADRLCSDVNEGYATHREAVDADVAARLKAMDDLADVLQAKATDPTDTPDAPDTSPLASSIPIGAMEQAVAEHNKQADEHTAVTEARYETALNYIFGSRAEQYRTFGTQAITALQEARKNKQALDLSEKALADVRQKQFSSSRMADTLTKDLARVYGKDHLSVAVTDDGKSYACRRGSDPATHLSEGERTTLSLLYFLRKLEDETVRDDKTTRIVVVDDPSSSLDREALFATHQWLVDTLKGFGQFIVLTHDFGLLRLFLKSQGSGWGNSQNKIKKGDADERRFPTVSFLEMYAATSGGARETRVAALPSMLRTHTSEYAYLFSKVMDGVSDGTDHDRLFLLPNAARRVLEVFTSYKVPHLGTFDQRLDGLMSTEDGNANPYRDVYDFCNRYSHGEGNESVEVLDARAVHGQIRRCMEFLKGVDEEHFERMCKATGTDAAVLS